MPRLIPQHYKILIKVFEKAGLSVSGEEASHIKMNRPDLDRPIIIPKYPEVGIDIIKANLRSAKISREEYFKLLADC
jgi:predicted RNA binding protein YcfA (HicA-like mRNA interferase family)